MKVVFAIVLTMGAIGSNAQTEPTGRRLRVIVGEMFPDGNVFIGGATSWDKRPNGAGVTMDREFSYVTPENDNKQELVNPSPGIWKWKNADNWIDKAEDENQVLRLHGPIGPQSSMWVKKDKRKAKELEYTLKQFMEAQCKRYDGEPTVRWMDVINEAVLEDGSWHGPQPGTEVFQNPWTIIGFDESVPLAPPLYIKQAFEIATADAPNTELVINQFTPGMLDIVWDKIKALVPYLRNQGLRVDGIGWQGHVNVTFEKDPDNMQRLHDLITWVHNNDMTFHITEKNVWLWDEVKNYTQQAETFAAVLYALLEHRDEGTVTWAVWNLGDGDADGEIRPMLDGSIWDRNYDPKEAYFYIQNILENPPPAKSSNYTTVFPPGFGKPPP